MIIKKSLWRLFKGLKGKGKEGLETITHAQTNGLCICSRRFVFGA